MCGIAGILTRQPVVDRDLVTAMTERLVHRGPVESGYHFEGSIGLGMRRLSIIDIEGGHQPIFTEDRSAAVVFNGEIYNYVELARELKARGHRFTTHSDTEVIAHLYEERGVDCFEALNGMFAIAIWDARRHRLVLARDRFGEKPLYYGAADGGVAFASEIKSLLLHPGVSRELDPAAVSDYLALMYVRAPRTPFATIRKLPPAHRLIADEQGIRIERWWDLAEGVTPASLSRDEAAERVRELLDDAVRIRLRSDVPVGAFLSGGLDSSAVCAMASRHMDRPLETYAVGFVDTQFDELGFARQVAATFNTVHHETIVGFDDALQHLPLLCWHLDEPHADSAIVPTFLVSQVAARELRVMLSGLGGDELFGGYPRYFDGLRTEHVFRALPIAARRAVTAAVSPWLDVRVRDGLRKNLQPLEDRYLSRETIFPPSLRRQLQNGSFGEVSLDREFAAYPVSDTANRLMFVDMLTYLPDDILHITDRMSMAVSLEVRTPFLDHRLVQFALSLPGGYKLNPWTRATKICFRQAMSRLLPAEILNRPKWGFGAPVRSWMQHGLERQARDLFRDSVLVDRGMLDARGVAAYLDDPAPSDPLYRPQRVWSLVMLELWARVFLIGGGERPSFDLPSLA